MTLDALLITYFTALNLSPLGVSFCNGEDSHSVTNSEINWPELTKILSVTGY